MGLSAWEKPSDSPAWGRDDRAWIPYVPEASEVRYGTNETQFIWTDNDVTSFTLTYRGDTTEPIAGGASLAAVESAINDLESVQSTGVGPAYVSVGYPPTNVLVGSVEVLGFVGHYEVEWVAGARLGIEADVFEVTATGGEAEVIPWPPPTVPGSPSLASNPLVLSTDGSHIAEGFYRVTGRQVEARGTIRPGGGILPDGGNLLGISLPSTPAPYRTVIGTVIAGRGNWRAVDCVAMVSPNADQTMSPHFVIIADHNVTSSSRRYGRQGPVMSRVLNVPTPAPGSGLQPWPTWTFEWYVTYEPEE